MSSHRNLPGGDDRSLRVATWRGDERTAYLVPVRARPSSAAIEQRLQDLTRDGYRAALTAALAPAEQEPFLQAGFAVHERLHLLARPVADPSRPARPMGSLRRGRRTDRPAILRLDAEAFTDFWHLDGPGLDDAMAATPSARLRVATGEGGPDDIQGYAITGRAGARGYLQRLAVAPAHRRQGVATALVVDALAWLRRWGAREVVVNTQETNASALALYEALGFRRQPAGLAVLRRDIAPSHL